VLIELRESDAPALITAGGEELSYRALAKAVRAEADALRGQGAGPGKLVALALPDAKQFVVSALAVWECGAVLLPLDVRAGLSPVQALIRRARPFLLRTAAGMERLPDGRELDARVALLLFTSGSSGPPKGVLLSRDGLRANVEAILRYLPAGRAAIVLPLTYSYALVGQVLTTLQAGATALLLGELKYPAEQLEAMVRLKATGLSSVPSSLRLLARAVIEGSGAPELSYVASAGAPLDPATVALIRTAFPGARLWNQYGLTEASPRVAAISDEDPAFAEGSAGRPLQGIDVRAEGEEILVRGPSVMLGYLDDPDATARALAGGWLHTGDVGRLDSSGRLFVHGRGDGVVKCAGERVGLDEVAAVLRECPGVADACVIALPDEALGARLVAFIESTPEVVTAARKALREKLLPAKRPGQIVALAELPRMPSGKIDRQALLRRAGGDGQAGSRESA
jgi:long-chain acyl-CoA synthetase